MEYSGLMTETSPCTRGRGADRASYACDQGDLHRVNPGVLPISESLANRFRGPGFTPLRSKTRESRCRSAADLYRDRGELEAPRNRADRLIQPPARCIPAQCLPGDREGLYTPCGRRVRGVSHVFSAWPSFAFRRSSSRGSRASVEPPPVPRRIEFTARYERTARQEMDQAAFNCCRIIASWPPCAIRSAPKPHSQRV